MDAKTQATSPANLQDHSGDEFSKPVTLRGYWLGLGLCILVLAAYIGTVIALNTETAQRATAPPWYAWVRYPPTRTRPQAVLLVVPLLSYAGWLWIVRRVLAKGRGGMVALSALACIAVFALNASTAMMDGGMRAIWKPFAWGGSEYYGDVAKVHGVADFLARYVDVANVNHFAIHTRTHPPGAVLLLYFVSRLFGPGIAAAAWAAVAITATGVVPAYLLARRLGGDRIARTVLALYPVVPSLVLFGATSMDGVFLPFLLWATYFLYRAVEEPGVGTSVMAALATALSLMLTYVTVCVVVLIAVDAMLKVGINLAKLWRIAAALVGCALLVLFCFLCLDLATGFNLLHSFAASRGYDHYIMRTSTHISLGRYLDISFCNLTAFLIGLGLPIVVLWSAQAARTLKRREWDAAARFGAATLATVLLFSFARLFTHETERIWLFFIPPALIGAARWIDVRRGGKDRRLLEWAMGIMFFQTWVFQLLLYTIW